MHNDNKDEQCTAQERYKPSFFPSLTTFDSLTLITLNTTPGPSHIPSWPLVALPGLPVLVIVERKI